MSQSQMSCQDWEIIPTLTNQRSHWLIQIVNASHMMRESQADWLKYMTVIKESLQTLRMKVLYSKNPKNSNTLKNCCNYPKI